MNRKAIGSKSEQVAAASLAERGYRILDRNARFPCGEIDLVALDRGVVVFVEVRSRRDDRHGHPVESLGEKKRRNLSRAALMYLKHRGWMGRSARFDVVTVLGEPEQSPQVEHWENAFELSC